MLEREAINDEMEMGYAEFETFLVSFLRHQFYDSIADMVTNKILYQRIGWQGPNGTLRARRRAKAVTRPASVHVNANDTTLGRNSGGVRIAEDEEEEGEGGEDNQEDMPALARSAEERSARASRLMAAQAKVLHSEVGKIRQESARFARSTYHMSAQPFNSCTSR